MFTPIYYACAEFLLRKIRCMTMMKCVIYVILLINMIYPHFSQLHHLTNKKVILMMNHVICVSLLLMMICVYVEECEDIPHLILGLMSLGTVCLLRI